MKGDHIDIDAIATLARIDLSADEKQKLSKDIDSILDFISKMDEVDTTNVEPSAHAHPVYNVFRKDIPGSTFDVETALLNAPEKRENQFVVQKVL